MEQANSIISSPTIPKGSTVCVTGVNGYIGSHVADQLLEAGYHVRGAVRSTSKADWLYELFDKKYGKGKFEAVEVPDMVADGAYDEAVKGVDGICHLASILTFSDKVEEVIPPTVKGTLNILTSASKEPSVKSVVYCSSSTAALMPEPGKKIKVTKDTWDDAAVKEANANPSPFVVYGASKTEAERAFWKAAEETHPPFQVSAVLPNCNFGPILKPGGEDSSSTASWAIKLAKGDKSVPGVLAPQWMVNVQDTARLHVAALIDPSCAGQRIFAFAEPFNCNDLLGLFRKHYPNHSFLQDQEGLARDLSEIPNQDAAELLRKHHGKGWTGLEDSLIQTFANVKL